MLDILNGHPNLMEFYGIYKLPPVDELLKLFWEHAGPPLDCYDTVAVFEHGLGNVHSHLKKLKKMFHKDNDKLFGHSQNTELIIFQYISRDILEGLEHIHKLGYVHLDLKPENICIFKNRIEDQPEPEMQQEHKITRKYIFKIIDLGSCRRVGEELANPQGTYTTAPPEILILEKEIKSEYSFDYYSFGVVLYYIYKGHFPLNSEGKEWRLHLMELTKDRFNDMIPWINAGSETMEKDHSDEARANRESDFTNFSDMRYFMKKYPNNYSLIIQLYNIIEGLISVEPAERYKYIKELKNLLSNINRENLTAKSKNRKTVKKSKKRKTRKLKQKKIGKKNKKRKTKRKKTVKNP